MMIQPRVLVFPTALSWISLVVDERFVHRLSFGHADPQSALVDVNGSGEPTDDPGDRADLVRRLQQYAEGAEDDFLDIELAPAAQTPFQQRVVELCRRIPFGSSITYGELADRAGHPRAARAVGNCMRSNPVPLIVPCHRVVGAGGLMRGYSAGEGVRMKLRLLELEAAACGAAS
jgi:methylated-DNA-[protein]-cysteine S-methyltransferase